MTGDTTTAPRDTTLDAVHRYYRCVDAEDVDGVLDLFDDGAVYRRPGYEPFRGRAALAAFYGGDRIIERGAHTLHTITAQGPRVAVTGSFAGRLKDGRDVAVEFADFFEFDGADRIVDRSTFFHAPMI